MGLETRQQLERVDIGPSIASDTTVTETQDLEDILADDAAEADVTRTAGGSRKGKFAKKW